ncbi:N-acetyl sugar amidotransferase [Prochlorococcus sp. AH-716-F13]|nr:N-acetyl sugar amidotransferase [Prochlorococcus sp. AH-716-F13]
MNRKIKPIIFCKRCLYSTNHPLGITLNEDGICSGCTVHEEKDNLDWAERKDLLTKIIAPYKSQSSLNYDCIVPVSGGSDSYFIVDIVKNTLKLKPLLVNYNKYFNTPLGIRNLANLRRIFDCDILIQNVNINSVKKIAKETLRRFGNFYWPCIAGQTVFPVQTAIKFKVPLIIWGAHQGLEQVGMFSHLNEVEMTRRYRKDHDLFGFEADDLIQSSNIINEEDIAQYRYPDNHNLNRIGVRGIYLGNYIRWDPKAQHELMIKKYRYETSSFKRTFDCYDHVDCFNYMDMHDLLKLYKHGYSKVTDHATREIRHKRLTRTQGYALVRKYELKNIEYSDLIYKWLGISKHSFDSILNSHRNPLYWKQTSFQNYEFNGLSEMLKNLIINKHDTNEVSIPKEAEFLQNSNLVRNKERKYIIVGKGYP